MDASNVLDYYAGRKEFKRGKLMSDRETGHVKWFNEKKGFGFIVNQQGDDIFVHYKDIQGVGFKTLHENDAVTFVLDKGPKGYKAQDVVVIAE
jgi:CspA family cold shock protein